MNENKKMRTEKWNKSKDRNHIGQWRKKRSDTGKKRRIEPIRSNLRTPRKTERKGVA